MPQSQFLEPEALQHAPAPLAAWIRKLSGLEHLREIYTAAFPDPGAVDFPKRSLEALDIRIATSAADLAHIPATGPALIAANHPFGMLEGLAFASLLPQIRPDFKILANHVLGTVPGMRDHLLLVDVFSGPQAAFANRRALTQAIEWISAGHLLVIFPAGEVSAWDWRQAAVVDAAWNTTVARLATRTQSPVIPAFFAGGNSLPFQMLGMIHPLLRTARLPAELLNKRGARVDLRIGTPIPAKDLAAYDSPRQQTEFLRARTYLLNFRSAANDPQPAVAAQAPVSAASPAGLDAEIHALPPDQLLDQSGDYQVFVATAPQIPRTLEEIGRLRELTFRQVGEGTGHSLDLDHFDAHYEHIFVWHRERRQIVGAYRLTCTEPVLRAQGARGLYTSTLFHYSPDFFRRLGPAIELGRSFVRPEYQREYAPLTLLWKGISRYAARHAEAPVLFGAVSVSDQYHPCSRTLMVEYLRRQPDSSALRKLVRARNPFRSPLLGSGELKRFAEVLRSPEALSTGISEMEGPGRGIPVLLRQYLKLGAQVLDFHVDRGFSNALDCLVLVDLRQADHATLRRFMGEQGVEHFLAFHRNTQDRRAS